MPTCTAGHQSGTDDYCDVCGELMGGASTVGAAQPPPAPAAAEADHAGEVCPDCQTPRTGRFCEEDGYDFVLGGARPTLHSTVETHVVAVPAAPVSADSIETASARGAAPPAPAAQTAMPTASGSASAPARAGTSWTAEVTADREYYERVLAQAGEDAEAFRFPPYAPKRRIPMTGEQMRIGRRSLSKGTIPEIDLGEPPEDPGVSHVHAVLLPRPDDRWILVDPGSTNGTTVNDGDEPVPVNDELPLHDGDRVHVGVWTTIILRRSQ